MSVLFKTHILNNMHRQLTIPKLNEIGKYFLLIIFIYVYIFQPPVIPKIYYPITELLIILVYGLIIERHFFSDFFSHFKKESALIISMILYSLLRDLLGGEIVYFDRFLLWFFQAFIFGFFIVKVTLRRNARRVILGKEEINIFSIVYWAISIAGVLTLLLILNPRFDALYETIQLDDYYSRYANFDFRYRAYGISENLTFTYSYVLGLGAGYSLLVLDKRKYLIVPFAILSIGVAFNARIGFVALILFIFIIVVQKRWKSVLYFLALGLIAFLVSVFFVRDISVLSRINNLWALDFFYQISDFIFGTNMSQYGNTLDILLGDYLVWPVTVSEWIFGTGKSLFTNLDNNTDIGYLLQLNYGGILFIALILFFMFYSSRRLIKVLDIKHWYSLFFLFSIFILNFKGFTFAGTPGGRLLFFLYVFFITKRSILTNETLHHDSKNI